MAVALPTFRYHPDPVATGSVAESDAECRSCGEARGYVYAGPVFAVEELDDALCPWCIADGSAAERFEAEFTDTGEDLPDDIPEAVLDAVLHRTPGFSGWQQEHWLFHCGDAAAYVGAGAADDDAGSEGSTSYLFQCLVCNERLAYADGE